LRNFFDELNPINIEESIKFQKHAEEKGKKLDYLIHKVFAQSDEGKELLEIWKESLIMSSTADEGQDMITIGINEGMKRFIRGVILTIRRVEGK
jgi:hypothetical protein